MPNTIALQKTLAETLDEALVAGLKTSAMEANADQVKYNGGNKFQFGKIDFGSLAAPSDYNRNTGYANSSVNLTFEEKQFKWDKGDSFTIDAMDVDESNFLVSAANVLSVYQKQLMIPDVDKKRIAEIARLAAANKITYDASHPLATLRTLIKNCTDETGLEAQDLICYISSTAYNALKNDSAVQKVININGSAINLNGNVKTVDDVEIVKVPDSRMGLVDILVLHREAPIAIVKHDVTKIITPEENQTADAWKIAVRVYHTLEIKDNELPAVHFAGHTAG